MENSPDFSLVMVREGMATSTGKLPGEVELASVKVVIFFHASPSHKLACWSVESFFCQSLEQASLFVQGRYNKTFYSCNEFRSNVGHFYPRLILTGKAGLYGSPSVGASLCEPHSGSPILGAPLR
jgi:hypothetical protein